MSQTIQSPSVTSLTKGLDDTQTFDPDETLQFPAAALVAADGPAAPKAADPAPHTAPPADEDQVRANSAHAGAVAARLWTEAPLPSSVQVHRAYIGVAAHVSVHLCPDYDLALLQQYVARYEGVLLHDDMPGRGVYSEYKFQADGVSVVVWTLNPVQVVAA